MLSIGLDMVGMFSLAVPAAVESWISSAMSFCWVCFVYGIKVGWCWFLRGMDVGIWGGGGLDVESGCGDVVI